MNQTRQRARSPATLPGYNKGRRPGNAGLRYRPQILTPDEARRLLNAPSARAPTGIRNRALLAILYRAGLRCAEALALQQADLDPDRSYVIVRRGKGDKFRTVAMDPGGFALVLRWLETKRKLGLRTPLVFCTLQGRPLYPSYVRTLLPRLGDKAGIGKRVHPHGLRHTFAAELAEEGKPPNVIQAWLGHERLSTTSIYLAHIAPVDLARHAQTRVWSLD
jgi:site-specific recombinase XerD